MLRFSLQYALIVAFIGTATLTAAEPSKVQNVSPFGEADLAFKTGDFAAALKSYQWYRSDAKLGLQARINAGKCFLMLGNPSAALREWQIIRDLSPEAPEAAMALGLEITNTADAAQRGKLEMFLTKEYANSAEAKALFAKRAEENAELSPESEAGRLMAAGKRDEAIKLVMAAAGRAEGDERDSLLGLLASLYESSGDWRKAAGVLRKIVEEGNPEFRESATFDLIRTSTAIGGNSEQIEDMWEKYLRDYASSPREHLAVTRLAELMSLQDREDEAAQLMERWLSTADGKVGASFVSQHLAELKEKLNAAEEAAQPSFAKDRLKAAAKLPEEINALTNRARTGKRTGKILNRVREIRRELSGHGSYPVLMFQLDCAEALALVGQADSCRALDFLNRSWERNFNLLATKDPAIRTLAPEVARDAISIAMDGKNHPAALVWAIRSAEASIPGDVTMVGFLKETAIRLVIADAKSEGVAILSLLESNVLPKFPLDSRPGRVETAAVARLKAICANGAAVRDDQWFVGEMPERLDNQVAGSLFAADLRFTASDTESALDIYREVLRSKKLDPDTEGYATMQLARCLATMGKPDDALRIYRSFEDALGRTKSAAPALLRAGTLCGGLLNDSRRALVYFTMVSSRYPASPEAELCDWYAATLHLWNEDLRLARLAFAKFEKKYPNSAFIPTLNKSIRPQL